jgi:hypothetical protein
MSTIKITNLTSSGAIVGNVVLPVVGNVAGTLTTLKATVDQLKTFVTAGAEANILAANAATIFANLNMKSYVDGQITAANIGVIGYINLGNTIQSAQIISANLGMIGYVDNGISTANLGMKGYVDSVANQSIYGNANVSAYLHTYNYNPYSNVNVAVYTNLSTYAYNANVTAANVGMKGYVDNQTYSNVQVATYLPTYNGVVNSLTSNGNLTIGGILAVGNVYVPTLANSAGTQGMIVYDNDYVYICIATDTWKRANISTW